MIKGKKLKHILVDRDIPQKEIAKAAGVSEVFISYIIKGYREPSVTVLKRITDYLGITVDELL